MTKKANAEQEFEELKKLTQRVQADFDNYRKRVEQEREQVKKSANADLILAILPVLDNFKRASAHAPGDVWSQGIKAIEHHLQETLKQYGLAEIEVKPGDQVDPVRHEVVGQEKGDQPEGMIIRVIESGYRLNGTVLRPAKVVVAG